MIATLVLDPSKTLQFLIGIIAGLVSCLVYLWWLWFTLWENNCCGNPPRQCTCFFTQRGITQGSICPECKLMNGNHALECSHNTNA